MRYNIISQTPVDDKSEVFLDYFLADTQEEAEEVYQKFAGLLNIVATSYARWSGIDKGDLFGTGLTGLARAVRDFDESRGGKFKTFAMFKIKNALNEHCRRFKAVVTVPSYVRTANTYITNIKGLLEGYSVGLNGIDEALYAGGVWILEDKKAILMAEADRNRIKSEFKKLKRLAEHSKIAYHILVDRSQYVPSDMRYDETMTQEDLYDREKQRVAAALSVSKLKDHMSDLELSIAEGIMEGRTYEEIGNSVEPKRSAVWVRQNLDKMRAKFSKLI